MTADIHLHTVFSEDAEPEATAENMILSAMEKGFSVMCFTDHNDPCVKPPSMCSTFEPDDYFRVLLPLKEKYRSRIKVLIGIECGMQVHLRDHFKAMFEQYPFDYVLGSQHLVYEIDPYETFVFSRYGNENTARHYFETISESLDAFDFIDALAHMDYALPVPDGSLRFEYFLPEIDAVLTKLIERDTALEFSSKGRRIVRSVDHFYEQLFQRYYDLGGRRVVFGSDAHHPDLIGEGAAEASETLRGIGFRHYTYYEMRKPADRELS